MRSAARLTYEQVQSARDRGDEVEGALESTLEDLRAYRKSDPNFERAIAAVVEAEMTAKHDPAEGRIVAEAGRNESAVLDLLNE